MSMGNGGCNEHGKCICSCLWTKSRGLTIAGQASTSFISDHSFRPAFRCIPPELSGRRLTSEIEIGIDPQQICSLHLNLLSSDEYHSCSPARTHPKWVLLFIKWWAGHMLSGASLRQNSLHKFTLTLKLTLLELKDRSPILAASPPQVRSNTAVA